MLVPKATIAALPSKLPIAVAVIKGTNEILKVPAI